ncbi:MAG: hypothetical protein ABIA75_07215 [Candidatus Neomarinimicrobiota bacterium]
MSDLKKLAGLQKIDTQLKKINDLLGDLPARVMTLKSEEQALIETLEQGKRRLKEIDLEIHKISVQEIDYTEKIDKYKNQLFLVTNNKQYDALMHEIDHLKAELDQSETHDLELREEKSTLEETTKSQELNLQSLSSDLLERRIKLERTIAESAEKKAELERQRQEQIQGISPAWLSRYERVLEARDGVAVVALSGSSCGGCGSGVPRQIVAEIKDGKGIRICDVCSRFLIGPE